MSLRIYRGSFESDMIETCLNEIENDRLSKHLVIIPEHYSYEMERKMVDRFGVIGLNGIEVVTPHRMAVNCLNTDNTRYLNPAGKQMLVVCAIDVCLNDDSISGGIKQIIGRSSFASNMVSLISEFKRHMITPEILESCACTQRDENSGVGHEHLADKLEAAAAVYRRYNDLLGDKNYIDSDDDAARLAAKILADIPVGNRIEEEEKLILPKKAQLREAVAQLKELYESYGDQTKLEEEIESLKRDKLQRELELNEAKEKRKLLDSEETAPDVDKKELTKLKTQGTKRVKEAEKKLNELNEKLDKAMSDSAEFAKHSSGLPERVSLLRKEIENIKKDSSLSDSERRIPIHGGTRVWFMCFDEYLPHHMELVRAAARAAKETTVCLNYVKPDDEYRISDVEMRHRELNRKFGLLFSMAEVSALRSESERIYDDYGVYVKEAAAVPENNISRDSVIYSAMEKSYNKLKAEHPAEERFFCRSDCVSRSREADFLVKHYGLFDRFDGQAKNVEIAECENPHREIEYAAESIHTLVRESAQKYESAKKREANDRYAADMGKSFAEVRALMSGALKEKMSDAGEAELDEFMEWAGAPVPRKPEESDLLRYRDIGILFGGASDYTHILDAIFTEHNIQYFADEKIILSEHPIAVQLLSVFDIFETDWSYEAMFRFLNAGFVYEIIDNGGKKFVKRLDSGEIARLDNYVIRYDIRGRRLWEKEWDFYGEIFGMTWEQSEQREHEKRENERVNALRAKICAPLVRLLPASGSEKKRASDYVAAMYEFLHDINIYEGLTDDVRRFENKDSSGAIQTAQQFSQIWNKLLEILNQINVTMGDMEITFGKFGEYLRAGLSQCEIRTIPSALDAVYTGTVERSTSNPVKKLFIMGAVSGTYPAPASYDGFFTDIDRGYIRSYNDGSIDLAPTKTEQRTKQRYKVFKAIRSAVQSISVTYPSSDNDGSRIRPSAFVTDTKDMFGIDKHPAFPQEASDEENITSEYAAKRGLVINSAAPLSRLSPAWRSVYRCLRDSGKHDKALEQIALAASFYSRPPRISAETANELYTRSIMRGGEYTGEDGRVYSATRLETYASCPMKFFMQYGLSLAEEAKAGVQANEVGTYVHKLVQTVCGRVYDDYEGSADENEEEKCRNAWHQLDEDKLGGYIAETISETEQNLSKSIPDHYMRRRVISRIKDTVTRSSVNVLRSLKQGEFVLKATELPIENVRLNPNGRVYINGAVDRVDEFRYFGNNGERENLLRIIDYKTGDTKFSESDIRNGHNMQLVIYAIAAAMQYEENDSGVPYRLSGIYYQRMRDVYRNAGGFGGGDDGGESNVYLDGATYLPPKKGTEAQEHKREAILKAINEGEEGCYIGLSEFVSGRGGKNAKTEEERDSLIETVKHNIEGIDKEIMSGRILPMPYDGGSVGGACEYCRFCDICSFEETKTKRRRSSKASFGRGD